MSARVIISFFFFLQLIHEKLGSMDIPFLFLNNKKNAKNILQEKEIEQMLGNFPFLFKLYYLMTLATSNVLMSHTG